MELLFYPKSSHISRISHFVSYKGQDVEPEEACRLAVLSAIQHHQKSKMENSKVCKILTLYSIGFQSIEIANNFQVCMMGKYHNILYIALKVSWDWGVKDSSTIRLLLGEYNAEGDV